MKKLLALLLVAVMIVSCCGATLTARKEEPDPTESPAPVEGAEKEDSETEFEFPELPNEKTREEITPEEALTVMQLSFDSSKLFDSDEWDVEAKRLFRVLDDDTIRMDILMSGIGGIAGVAYSGGETEDWDNVIDFMKEISTLMYENYLVPSDLEDHSMHIVMWNDIEISPYKILAEVVNGEVLYDFVNEIDLRPEDPEN